MHELMLEKARELGRILGQTDEYKAVAAARTRVSEDRDAVQKLNRLAQLEVDISRALQKGEEPTEEVQQEYEDLFTALQSSPIYQAVVAAQTNFDKLVGKVNDEITKGIEAGAQSRIILPS